MREASTSLEPRDPAARTRNRRPVELTDRLLRIDGRAIEAYSRHIDDVLVAYIELVRTVRRLEPDASMSFRRLDIDALAEGLGRRGSVIVDHLAALVGADADRLQGMQQLYQDGSSWIDSGVPDVEGEDEPDAPDADSLSDIEGGPEIVSPGRR